MKDIGGTVTRSELRELDVLFNLIQHIQHAYVCESCAKQGFRSEIVKAPVPKALIGNSLASPYILAQTMVEKYDKKVPAYRQEKQWGKLGIPLTRQNIINWQMLASERMLENLHDLMKQELLTQDIIHADETPSNVIERDVLLVDGFRGVRGAAGHLV